MNNKRTSVLTASVLIATAGIFYYRHAAPYGTAGVALESLEKRGLRDAVGSDPAEDLSSDVRQVGGMLNDFKNGKGSLSGSAAPVIGATGDAAAARPAAGSIVQAIPFLTEAQRQAARDAFFGKTGMTVNLADADVFGYIVDARKTPGAAAGAARTQEQALQEATKFFHDNAAALGYTDEDIAAARAQVNAGGSGNPWYVLFSGDRFPSGYERFPSVQRHISVGFEIGADGHVFQVLNDGAGMTTNNLFPGLSLPTTPKLKADDPALRASVMGQKLQWVTGGDEGVPMKTKAFGVIEPANIQSDELSIYPDWNKPGALLLHLVYDFRVSKGGHTWSILIDAGNGTQLRWSQIVAVQPTLDTFLLTL